MSRLRRLASSEIVRNARALDRERNLTCERIEKRTLGIHQQILVTVWGAAYARETQYLRVYMGQLRQKLEANPARPRYLVTEPGAGYRVRAE